MKYNKIVTALVAAGVLIGAGSLQADGDQPFHVTVQFGSLYTDSARNTRDDDHHLGKYNGLGGKLDLAMQLILTPMILQLMERSRRAGGPRKMVQPVSQSA